MDNQSRYTLNNDIRTTPMKSPDSLHTVDFPIVICSPDWKVIYRNQAAYRELSHFRMSSSAKRLAESGDLEEIDESGRAAFVSFPGESMKRALVCPYFRGGQRCFIMAFLVWAQVNRTSLLTSELEKNTLELVNSLAGDLSELDTGFICMPPRFDRSRISRLREITMRNISIYLSPERDRVYDVSKSLRSVFSLLSYMANEVFAKLGYTIEMELQDKLNPSGYYIEKFNSFCAVCADLLTCALDASCDRKAHIFFSDFNGRPCMSIKIKLPEGSYVQKPTTSEEFASFFPTHRISALVCCRLCTRMKWQIGIAPDEFDRSVISINLISPRVRPRDIVREHDEQARDLLVDFIAFINRRS